MHPVQSFAFYSPTVKYGAALSSPRSSDATAKRVLVAEDEPTLLRLMERVLEREGHSVLTAANGDDALRCLAQHAGEIGSAILDAAIWPAYFPLLAD